MHGGAGYLCVCLACDAGKMGTSGVSAARLFEKAHQFNLEFLMGPKEALADAAGDTPPMPMSAFGAGEGGDEGGSGCFIRSLSGR